ncbi:hypothetical protein ACU686_13375 [Yinghuangia aomiensis]
MLKELRAPKPEKLRVLLLGAASDGDLRTGREQQRIRAAVQAATHRDLVELDVHPAATADVFLDGLTRFRPHVVHLLQSQRGRPHRVRARHRRAPRPRHRFGGSVRQCDRCCRRAAATGPAELLQLRRADQEADRRRAVRHRHV